LTITGPAERLTIFIDETDRHGHTPLYTEIVQRARKAGLAGATVLHGVEGFGASSRLHAAGPWRLSENLPAVIVIIDQPERIAAFLPVLDELIGDGLVVRQPVELIAYRSRTR
jgi:uncharacterized protein